MFTLIELAMLLAFGTSSFFLGMLLERHLWRRNDPFGDRWKR